MTLVMFTKMLKQTGNLTIDEAGDVLVDLGVDGADLTVRDGGYVDPSEAAERLPEVVDTLEANGLEVPMITTRITGADEDHAEEILRTASECDIDHLKLGYWLYDGFGRMNEQMDEMPVDLNGIYRMSKRYSVTPSIHIHSADYMSAEAAVLRYLLRGYDPDHLGAYISPGHMAVEGGVGGWKMGMDLLQEFTKICSIKNFGWEKTEDESGDVTWEPTKYSLEDGLVPYETVFRYLDEMDFEGPLTVHSEYYHKDFEALMAQTEENVAYVRQFL